MNYVDFSIAVSIFLFFFVIMIIFITNYFSGFSGLTRTSEYRVMAENLYKQFFSGEGRPTDWEEDATKTPVQIGLSDTLYAVPFLVEEDAGTARINEPLTIYFNFDASKAWNNTLRIYNTTDDTQEYNFTEASFSSSQFLSNVNMTFLINISANEKKKYWLYYSADQDITAPSYSVTYDTASWIPNDGDSYTEATTSWATYVGSGTITADSDGKLGDNSINITGTFNGTGMGMKYDPDSDITGVSNGWYIHMLLYIDNITSIDNVYLVLDDGSETITYDVKSGLASEEWATISVEISSSWNGWSSFNATDGIDYAGVYAVNSTSGLTRTIKVDAMRFTLKPLTVKKFPEEELNALAEDKLKAFRSVNYDELRKIFGENYKYRIEISEQ